MRVSQVAEVGVAAKVADVAKRVEVAVLQRVFRFRVVLQDRARDPEQLAVVPAHQRLERAVIAARDATHELGIVARRGCGRSRLWAYHGLCIGCTPGRPRSRPGWQVSISRLPGRR